MTHVKAVEKRISNILNFLKPLLPLANFHMVEFFTSNGFATKMPSEILKDLENNAKKDLLRAIFSGNLTNFPHTDNFFRKSKELTLKNMNDVCLGCESFQDVLNDLGCDELLRMKLEIFMSEKKSHEVEKLSCIAAAVRNVANTSHIVDVGGGRGYLSSMLALHHKVPVLGVDASEINTNSAVERVSKLSKVWNSVVAKEKSKSTSIGLYKQVTQYVNEHTDFRRLVKDIFLEEPTGLSLVGLHTCGNLAPNSVRIFCGSDHIKTICNVGCCYHFLNEGFGCDDGFPMSDFLKNKQFVLGKAARMVAAQSVDRILNKKELPHDNIFYRALLEVFLEKFYPDMPKGRQQVGRFKKGVKDFEDYVEKSCKRINLRLNVASEDINDLYKNHKDRVDELNVFHLIRSMLSPVIESLILLDRLLFIKERGIEKCFLVQLFDPVVSPRCYGLIAIK